MQDLHSMFGHSVEYAVVANPEKVFAFCEKHGEFPINEKDAVNDVLAIMASSQEATEEFFLQVHPDADVYKEFQKDKLSSARVNVAPAMPDIAQYFEFRVALKDLVLVAVVAFVAYLISSK